MKVIWNWIGFSAVLISAMVMANIMDWMVN